MAGKFFSRSFLIHGFIAPYPKRGSRSIRTSMSCFA
jgi:hypothetical protein